MQVDNLPIRDEKLTHPTIPKTGKIEPVKVDSKPELNVKLTAGDYKNLAKEFFLANFQSILSTALTGSPVKLAVIGVILALLLLFWTGIL